MAEGMVKKEKDKKGNQERKEKKDKKKKAVVKEDKKIAVNGGAGTKEEEQDVQMVDAQGDEVGVKAEDKKKKTEKREKGGKRERKVKRDKTKGVKEDNEDTQSDKMQTDDEDSGGVKLADGDVNWKENINSNGETEKKEKKGKERREKKKEEKKDGEQYDEEIGKDAEANLSITTPSKKRKRSTLPEGELAIDLSAPEPPSKKALRKLKKAGIDPTTAITTTPTNNKPASTPGIGSTQVRSKHGVWIGNLAFNTTESQLKEFLLSPATLSPDHEGPKPIPENMEITRLNIPTKTTVNPTTKKPEVRNRGFAYVDFTSKEAVRWTVKYKSEKLLLGRKVLIKDANDYTGRPALTTTGGTISSTPTSNKKTSHSHQNPPSKILFIGNLPFETTDDELITHFSFASNDPDRASIKRVRLGRFEDSGICKGFGFVDFEDEECVTRAIKATSLFDEDDNEEEALEGKEEVVRQKIRKRRWGERMFFKGRRLRLEYGENEEVRYKKRWGSGKMGEEGGEEKDKEGKREKREGEKEKEKDKKEKKEKKEKKAKPVEVARLTGGIVESKGKKVKFEE